jgi:hypothetical protein
MSTGCSLARLSSPPEDAEQRARQLARDLERYRILRDDIAALDDESAVLLAATDGQILTTLPGAAVMRAAAFRRSHSAHRAVPRRRAPLPPAWHRCSTSQPPCVVVAGSPARAWPNTATRSWRIAWGLSLHSPSFAERDTELRARGMIPIQARVALARNACRLTYRLLVSQQPFDEERYRQGRLSRGG